MGLFGNKQTQNKNLTIIANFDMVIYVKLFKKKK